MRKFVVMAALLAGASACVVEEAGEQEQEVQSDELDLIAVEEERGFSEMTGGPSLEYGLDDGAQFQHSAERPDAQRTRARPQAEVARPDQQDVGTACSPADTSPNAHIVRCAVAHDMMFPNE